MPDAKNGERPYLAVPETTFWGSILGLIWRIFLPFYPHLIKHTTILLTSKSIHPN